MTKTLSNFYYFIENNVVTEISYAQDKDGCGQHLVTYLPLTEKHFLNQGDVYIDENGEEKIAEETGTYTTLKFVKGGEYYYDLHGDRQIAEIEGYYYAKSGKIDIEKCKEVFPYIEVKYSKIEGDEEEYTDIYWLQDLITDGDTFDGTFTMKEGHGNGYVQDTIDKVWDDYEKLALNHTPKRDIYNMLPKFCFNGMVIKRDNEYITINDVESSDPDAEFDFSEETVKQRIASIVQDNINKEYKEICDSYEIEIAYPDICEECPECPECPEYYYLNNLQTITGNDFFNNYNMEERAFIEEHYDVAYEDGYSVQGCAPIGDIPEPDLSDYVKMYSPMSAYGINITEEEYDGLNECDKENYEEVYCLVMRTYTIKDEYKNFSEELGNFDTYDRFTYEIRHKFYVKRQK